jgi:hypothetical protein
MSKNVLRRLVVVILSLGSNAANQEGARRRLDLRRGPASSVVRYGHRGHCKYGLVSVAALVIVNGPFGCRGDLLQKQQEVETGEGSKRGDSDVGMACHL